MCGGVRVGKENEKRVEGAGNCRVHVQFLQQARLSACQGFGVLFSRPRLRCCGAAPQAEGSAAENPPPAAAPAALRPVKRESARAPGAEGKGEKGKSDALFRVLRRRPSAAACAVPQPVRPPPVPLWRRRAGRAGALGRDAAARRPDPRAIARVAERGGSAPLAATPRVQTGMRSAGCGSLRRRDLSPGGCPLTPKTISWRS